MKVIFIYGSLLAIALLCTAPIGLNGESCTGGKFWSHECIVTIAERIYEMHKWHDGTTVNLLGKPCIGRVQVRFKPFKWLWDGFIECGDGLVGGEARGYTSRSAAIQHAIQNFLTLNTNLLSHEQKLELINLE